jgi:DNA invertase Pin-like site-specific DNA recombinase
MSKVIAIYVRVSSNQQSTRSQLPDLQRWAKSQDGSIRWFEEKSSGRTMDRPAWKRLEAEIDSGKVGTVTVWRLDRLGRTASGLTALFDKLIARKVNLVSIRDGLDLSTAAGRLMANVLASVAAYESEIRSERVQAGQARARAQGKKWGGSVKGHWTKVTPTQRKAIRHMKEQGETVVAIAQAVGLSRPTIYTVLGTAAKKHCNGKR